MKNKSRKRTYDSAIRTRSLSMIHKCPIKSENQITCCRISKKSWPMILKSNKKRSRAYKMRTSLITKKWKLITSRLSSPTLFEPTRLLHKKGNSMMRQQQMLISCQRLSKKMNLVIVVTKNRKVMMRRKKKKMI